MNSAGICGQLVALGRRELSLRLAWGAARWLGVVVAALILGALVDYAIDRYQDTPWSVRVLLSAGQLVVAAAAAFWFLILPVLRGPSKARWRSASKTRCPAFNTG